MWKEQLLLIWTNPTFKIGLWVSGAILIGWMVVLFYPRPIAGGICVIIGILCIMCCVEEIEDAAERKAQHDKLSNK